MLSKKNYIFSVRNFSNFPSLEEMVDNKKSLFPRVREEIVDHLEILSKSFDEYFGGGELETSEEWIINLYSFNLDKLDDEVLKEDLIELRTNPVLEMQFESKTLEQYWYSVMDMFPRLCEKVLTVLILFMATYLCKSGFRQNLEITFINCKCIIKKNIILK